MSDKKHFIKMHVCESVSRHRNSLLHEADEAGEIKTKHMKQMKQLK